MGVSAPVGYPTNYKVPGIRIAVDLGVGSRSAGGAARKLLLIANKLAAGTMADNTPTFCPSPDDGSALTGAGSELDQGIRAVFAQYTRPNLWIMSNAENGASVKATATILIAGSFSAAGSLNLRINGRYIPEITVATTDTPTTIATRIAAAITAKTGWNVTATSSTATVTIQARNGGPRGNNTSVRAESTAAGLTMALNGGSALAKVSGRFGTGTATVGAGADDIQAALDAIFPKKYDRIAIAHTDSGNISKVRTHINSCAAIMEGRRQQFNCATIGDLSALVTLTTSQNAPRCHVVWHYNADQTTMEIAAQEMCARLYGDGAVGGGIGKRKGEETYHAANLAGCMLASITEQVDVADQPLETEMSTALDSGGTPLAPSAANPGFVQIVRPITSRFLDAASNPNYAVLDIQKVTVPDFMADDLTSVIFNEFPAKNLAPEPTEPIAPPTPDVIFPSMVKSVIKARLFDYQNAMGLIVLVEANLVNLIVEADPTNPALIIATIPADVIEGFHNFAGAIEQIG